MRPPFPDEITASNFLNHRSLLFLRPHSFFRLPLRRPLFSVYGVGLHTIGLGNSFGGGSLVQTIGSGGWWSWPGSSGGVKRFTGGESFVHTIGLIVIRVLNFVYFNWRNHFWNHSKFITGFPFRLLLFLFWNSKSWGLGWANIMNWIFLVVK